MQKNMGEEFKMQNSYEFSTCRRETALAIEMRELHEKRETWYVCNKAYRIWESGTHTCRLYDDA